MQADIVSRLLVGDDLERGIGCGSDDQIEAHVRFLFLLGVLGHIGRRCRLRCCLVF